MEKAVTSGIVSPAIAREDIVSNLTADFLTRFAVTTVPYSRIVRALERKRFWAILLDIDDKETDGLYTPRVLRKQGVKIPIVGVSEDLFVREEWPMRTAEFLNSGGDYLLKAPPNPDELDASINAAVRRMCGGIS